MSSSVLQLSCHDASLAIRPVFDRFETVVITFGTLSPIDLYPRLLNFNPVISRSFTMSLTRDCICPMVLTRGRYEWFWSHMNFIFQNLIMQYAQVFKCQHCQHTLRFGNANTVLHIQATFLFLRTKDHMTLMLSFYDIFSWFQNFILLVILYTFV